MKKLKYKVGDDFIGYKFESKNGVTWYSWKHNYIGLLGKVKAVTSNKFEVMFSGYDFTPVTYPMEYLNNKIQDKLK